MVAGRCRAGEGEGAQRKWKTMFGGFLYDASHPVLAIPSPHLYASMRSYHPPPNHACISSCTLSHKCKHASPHCNPPRRALHAPHATCVPNLLLCCRSVCLATTIHMSQVAARGTLHGACMGCLPCMGLAWDTDYWREDTVCMSSNGLLG